MAMTFKTTRHVHRLSLKASSDEIARRSAIVIGDALHTATIPAADQGRIVIIRKLALGRIASDASSHSIALRVEQCARTLIAGAVSANSPSAAFADAVSFRDFSEAVLLCARRIIARQNLDEWFWYKLFPALNPGKSPGESIFLLIDLIHAQPESLQMAADIISEAARAGIVSEVSSFITETKVRQWLWSEGLNPYDDLQQMNRSTDINMEHSLMVVDQIYKWGCTDVRSFWLAAVLLAIEKPAFILKTDFSSHVKMLLNKLGKHVSDIQDTKSLPISNLKPDNLKPDNPNPCSFESMEKVYKDKQIDDVMRMAENEYYIDSDRVEVISYKNDYRHHKNISEDQENDSCISETILMSSAELTKNKTKEKKGYSPSGERTNFAGLFFLVPVLERLGIREFIERNKALENVRFGEQIIMFAGLRLGMEESDPLTAALGDNCDLMTIDSVLELPPLMKSFQGESGNAVHSKSVLKLWLKAVRHLCRRTIHMGLFNIVRRNGFVFITKNNIDICFNLDQADIRLRRNALDVDPGWVPWMDRVIRFHYGDTENGW